MKWIHRAGSVFRHLFRKQRVEAQLDAELRSYLAMLTDRNLAAGMSPEAAARAAQLEFEGLEQVKEKVRDARVGATIDAGLMDLRYAWRALRRSPSFTLVAVMTLALGIGVNTAIFSVVYAELLRPLPYDRPQELALLWSSYQKMGVTRGPASGPLLREVRQRSRVLQDVGAIWTRNVVFTGEGNAEQVKVGFVTTNFLGLLGTRPVLGRLFTPDERAGGRTAVILSNGLWRRRYAADPEIVGKKVVLDGRPITVAGVLPPDFRLYFPADANVPAELQAYLPFFENLDRAPLTLYYVRMVGRMRRGATLTQLQQDMDSVASQICAAYSAFADEGVRFQAVSMHADAMREVRPALVALFAGAGLVLLICCTNVANLLLARASDGRRDIALRAALGASQARVLWQLFSEGLILCVCGGAAGLALAWAGIRFLVRLQPEYLARIQDVAVNWPVLAFAALASLLSVMLFGMTPLFELRRWDLFGALRESKTGMQGRGPRLVRSGLIVCEIMLGCILVIGAGLMIRTLKNIHHVHPGFEPRQLLTFEIELPGSRYNRPAMLQFSKQWEDRILALPGVEAVGSTSHLPLDNYPNWYSPFRPEGVPEKDASGLLADHRCVTPGYLRAMGTKLIEGRLFDQQDRADGRQVAIVDELLARSVWPGQSAIGKRLESEHFTPKGIVPVWTEVVGVVEHVRGHSLSKEVRPEIYIPFEQSPRSHLVYAVRTRGEPLQLARGIREALQQRDRDLAISKISPMTAYVERAASTTSFTAVLASLFAGLALLLAAIGIYGVVYYSVSRRTQEMGVRMALGAKSGDVVRLVLGEGMWLAAVGIGLGLAGSLAAAHFLRTLVYGVSATDPVTYGVSLVVVAVAAMAGCWRPAAKAASANPMDAIRTD